MMTTLDTIIQQAAQRKPKRRDVWQVYTLYKNQLAWLGLPPEDYQRAIARLRKALKV